MRAKTFKTVLVSVVALCCFGTSMAYGDALTKKIRVFMNGQELFNLGVVVDDKPYLAVDAVAKQYKGITAWDEKKQTLSIDTPNVHMATRETKEGGSIFGAVAKNQKVSFNVFTQIDSLDTDISSFKITLVDPYGSETLIEERKSGQSNFPEKGKTSFWINSAEITYKFTVSGDYTVRFYMKPVGDVNSYVVSEKLIICT
ncbi:hypothetical protein DFQ01_12368 [Paenibacillus cellulosilyticus]|uniref:Copper amine oxidase-like protein n=1 Tax=Paenibacillus cellulosilyticus TaxID=375489 RepID=A0A2V2YXA1_9BACL|nr:hypothetical protein [Paenibacillus cellulosilyticus]PWV95990.1 hypothetical protein DFQ01_12368 [Paenibacillus cellulosilyticus]QKS48453.1 hypothetical protein HUB94_29880 [Paenibacillus cellulosilyticus]